MQLRDEELAAILAKLELESQAKILRYNFRPFSEKRTAGINGDPYVLAIDVVIDRSSSEKVADDSQQVGSPVISCFEFFAKTPAAQEMVKVCDPDLFLEEVNFYKSVLPTLARNFDKNRVQWAPNCFVAEPHLIVLDDLRRKDFAPRVNSIYSAEDLKSALRTLAHFHACSVVAQRRLGRIDLAFSGQFREKVFTKRGINGRANDFAFETLALIAERLGLDGGELPKILAHLSKQLDRSNTGELKVICHGDLWRSNILFDNCSPSKCILVDYQMLRYASPCTDIAMLMYVHTSREFRQHSEKQMLDYYFDHFSCILRKNEIMDIPKRLDFHDSYLKWALLGKAYVCLRWPKIVFEEIIHDPDALEKWLFQNRIDIYQQCMDNDPNFEKNLRDCLKDLIDEGKRTIYLS